MGWLLPAWCLYSFVRVCRVPLMGQMNSFPERRSLLKIYSMVVEYIATQFSKEQKSTWQVDTHTVLPPTKFILTFN